MSDTKTVLIIPDAHARPGFDNDRFAWLGEYIAHRAHKIDLVVCLGDFADMASLSLYDVGKRKAEGQRYEADLEAVWEANELLWAPLHKRNKQLLRAGTTPIELRRVMCLGNHENRIDRAANDEPKFYEWISTSDLKYEDYGWEVIPFLQPFFYEGAIFQHYFTAGNMDRSIGGSTAARRLTLRDGFTNVMGHSHDLQVSFEGRGKKRWGIVAGCYFDYEVDYVSKDAQNGWWPGITILHGLDGSGNCTPMFVDLKYLRETFG